MGIISPPPVGIGLTDLQKKGVPVDDLPLAPPVLPASLSVWCVPQPPRRCARVVGWAKLESFQWLSPIEFSFGEMEDYLYQVAQNHSDLVKVSVEGLTEEGRPIYLLKIGGRGGENEDPLTSASTATIFIDAGRRLQLLLHLRPLK